MRRLAAAVVAAGLVLLSGCTGSEPNHPTAGGPSSPPAIVPDSPATVALVAAGLKTQSGSYHNDVTITSPSSTLTIAADIDPQTSAVQLVMDTQGVSTTVRVIGTDMYVTGLAALNGKWVKEDIGRLVGVQDVLDTFQQNFPLLAGISGVREDPPGTFTGTVDPRVALSRATTDAAREALSKIISVGSTEIPFTAKVADGYLVETTAQYRREENGLVGDSTVVSKLSRFGKIPPIKAPPPSDIVTTS
jgi:hypothetical protein